MHIRKRAIGPDVSSCRLYDGDPGAGMIEPTVPLFELIRVVRVTKRDQAIARVLLEPAPSEPRKRVRLAQLEMRQRLNQCVGD
jgi:hypothetical protein